MIRGNPYQTYPATLPIQALFDPLTNVDELGNVEPWLATDWSSQDSIKWTFNLRDDVIYSNGEIFNAAAVVATLDYLKGDDGMAATTGRHLVDVISAEAVSDYTVKVTLRRPDPLFAYRAANWRIPAPAHFEALGIDDFIEDPVGTGPYKPVKWTPNKVKFVANETSWRPPNISKLEIALIPDQVVRRQAIISGTFDIVVGMGPSDKEELERVGAKLRRRPAATFTFIAFALERYPDSPLQDMRIRKALNYAVNRAQIVDVILEGYPQLLAQLASPAAPGYDPTLSPYPYDPERAKALLKEAGYENGFSVKLIASAPDADEMIIYQQVAANLTAVGVKTTIQLFPILQTTNMLFSGDIKGELFALLARPIDTIEDYRYRSCLGLAGSNKPVFCDPAVIPLLEQARAANSLEGMAAAMNKVMNHEHHNPPGIFLWEGLEFDGLAPRILTYKAGYNFIHFHAITLAANE
jgi:peptide/nickel transport system substrate-binding protein